MEVFAMSFYKLVKQIIVISAVVAWIKLKLKGPELFYNTQTYTFFMSTEDLDSFEILYI